MTIAAKQLEIFFVAGEEAVLFLLEGFSSMSDAVVGWEAKPGKAMFSKSVALAESLGVILFDSKLCFSKACGMLVVLALK